MNQIDYFFEFLSRKCNFPVSVGSTCFFGAMTLRITTPSIRKPRTTMKNDVQHNWHPAWVIIISIRSRHTECSNVEFHIYISYVTYPECRMLSVHSLSVIYAECCSFYNNAEILYAQCRYSECRAAVFLPKKLPFPDWKVAERKFRTKCLCSQSGSLLWQEGLSTYSSPGPRQQNYISLQK